MNWVKNQLRLPHNLGDEPRVNKQTKKPQNLSEVIKWNLGPQKRKTALCYCEYDTSSEDQMEKTLLKNVLTMLKLIANYCLWCN